jgi:eukaryotic translation initiation factor 2C
MSLGGGLEAWKGFYSSVRPAYNQLMVNVNVCTTAFYSPGNLADAMIAFRNASFGAKPNAFVKGVRVEATHLTYRKTVKGMAKETARTYSFDCSELGGRVTVEEYFRRSKQGLYFSLSILIEPILSEYNIRLQKPDLPLVDVGGAKKNYLPAEVLEILPGQAFKGKLSDEHTAAMITAACKPPNVNGMAIVSRGLDELGFRSGASPLGGFGISIGTEMAVVPGRILPPPGIKYGQGTPRVDERASWNLRDVKFAVGGRLEKWAVLLIQDGNPRDEFQGVDDPELRQVVAGFAKMCRTSGMSVDQADPMFAACRLPNKDANDPTRAKSVQAIRATLTGMKAKPNAILVILSNGDKHVYSGIKHLCDSYLDVATVCVHASKIRKEKGQLQYYANVALKLNMKLGGINHSLDARSMSWLQQAPTMLVGMDVTHPGPGSTKGTVRLFQSANLLCSNLLLLSSLPSPLLSPASIYLMRSILPAWKFKNRKKRQVPGSMVANFL